VAIEEAYVKYPLDLFSPWFQGEQNGEIRLQWNTKFEFLGYLEILGGSLFFPTSQKKEHNRGPTGANNVVGNRKCGGFRILEFSLCAT
jgi:hypothetical protein